MYKVMIVDDENIIVEGLARMMPWEKYDCEVCSTASNGEEALAMIRKQPPDILFTDIHMPGMDGLALISALRSEFPEMQVTILSGYSEFEYAQKAIRLGVCNYILKPSKMDELEQALATMRKRLEREKRPEQADGASDLPLPEQESREMAGNFIIQNAVRYIEEHYAEKLSLPEVADQVYVSQWHLSKLIAKNTGQSFSELLNGVRVREAKKLLEDPSLKIWEISEQVGFSDVTHFSRIFKKLEKCSANEYRNQLARK